MIKSLEECNVEKWFCYDDRLEKQFTRVPPTKEFITDIERYGILHLPVVGHNDVEGYFLICGRKRIMAVRDIYQRQMCDGNFHVRIAEGVSRQDAYYLQLIENGMRDENRLSDFAAIRLLIDQSGGAITYQKIGKETGIPWTTVKNIAETYGNVPQEALQGALDGIIADTTLREISRLSNKQQAECMEILRVKKALPMSAINDLKRVRKSIDARKQSAFVVTSTVNVGRKMFTRAEVQAVFELAASTKGARVIADALEKLLNS